jgi:hypothetical protein
MNRPTKNSARLSKSDRAWTQRRLASTISRVKASATLAEKLWDTFRSMCFYRGACRKTYAQLGTPSQNLWLAVAVAAEREVHALDRHRRANFLFSTSEHT